MADSSIGLPLDGPGKLLDAEKVSRGGVDYYRERDTILVAANPVRDPLMAAALAAGASVDLDASTIAVAKTGKLVEVFVASSVACKWIVKTRDGGIELTLGVLFTGGLTGDPNDSFQPPDKGFCTLLGNGVDENFRVTVTNLDARFAADVYATVFWDEVP